MLEPTFNLKQAFFDRQKVISSVDRAARKAMSRSLAFVRTNARRNQLRRRKRVSTPGSPPSVHSKGSVATLRNVLFAYDERTKSGIVGPVKLNQRNMTAFGSISIPSLMEFGGTVSIQEEQWKSRSMSSGMWFRRDQRSRSNPGKRYRTRRATYAPRPFMGKALESESQKGNIASPWANVMSS